VTWTPLSRSKGQGHQAAFLTAALTHAGAAVTVRTYWAWETTATLRLLSGAQGAHRGGEGRGHIVSPRAHYDYDTVLSNKSFIVHSSYKFVTHN